MCTHVHTPKGGYVDICTRTFYNLHSAIALEGGVVLSDLKIFDNTWHHSGSHSKNSMNSVWKCFKISALTYSGRRMGRILGVLDKKKIRKYFNIHGSWTFCMEHHWNAQRYTLCAQGCGPPWISGCSVPRVWWEEAYSHSSKDNARAVKFQFHYA